MLDGATDTVLADYSQINTELALFDENLAKKPQIVVFNKIDLPEAQARWPDVQRVLQQRGVEVIPISAATHQNTDDLVKKIFQVMSTLPDEIFTEPVTERPVYDLADDEMAFDVTRKGTNSFRVSGRRIERAAAMTYWDYAEAVARFQQILETLGVSKALEEAGVQPGDTVYIGNHELEWSDE
jgi:GTP-binding protein